MALRWDDSDLDAHLRDDFGEGDGMDEQARTRVVHVADKVSGAIYIGRPMPRQRLKGSIWANPFHIGKDGTREEVLAKYRAYISENPYLLEQLYTLKGNVLACWCKPQACHGDLLASWADSVRRTGGWDCVDCGQAIDWLGNPMRLEDPTPLCYDCAEDREASR